ncbi:MAG: carboxypeptidase-like regulatory domain-containing protein [Cytophagales bacterium]|nr:carboxypeptidase-like regulatory domain-containing protein [Cytophagales bacterium]
MAQVANQQQAWLVMFAIEKTGEPVIGASVLIENPLTGVATDPNGYYSITLPRGTHALQIQEHGHEEYRNVIFCFISDGENLNIELEEDVLPLKRSNRGIRAGRKCAGFTNGF